MAELSVRPFAPADKAAVWQIAGDTGFFGAPVEAFLDDRRVFLEYFMAYYTDIEPQHGWVAADGDTVIGFLMGCADTGRQVAWTRRRVWPMLGGIVAGRYRLGRRTWRYLAAFLPATLRGDWPAAHLDAYPAHLHLNVAEAWRGRGLGRRLLQAYLAQLAAARVTGVHLETTNRNEVACRLYESLGFRLAAARPTRLWAHVLDAPVENRVYARRV